MGPGRSTRRVSRSPSETRSIDYTMDFIRHKFNDNDSFIDDNALVVTASVPEPSAFVMMCIGSLAVVGWRVRLRRRDRPMFGASIGNELHATRRAGGASKGKHCSHASPSSTQIYSAKNGGLMNPAVQRAWFATDSAAFCAAAVRTKNCPGRGIHREKDRLLCRRASIPLSTVPDSNPSFSQTVPRRMRLPSPVTARLFW